MTTWTSLGDVLDSKSAAASWSPLEIHVTAVETDDQMYHLSEFGVAAHQWEELGGVIKSAPAMAGSGLHGRKTDDTSVAEFMVSSLNRTSASLSTP